LVIRGTTHVLKYGGHRIDGWMLWLSQHAHYRFIRFARAKMWHLASRALEEVGPFANKGKALAKLQYLSFRELDPW
jgi:hypothetical protein